MGCVLWSAPALTHSGGRKRKASLFRSRVGGAVGNERGNHCCSVTPAAARVACWVQRLRGAMCACCQLAPTHSLQAAGTSRYLEEPRDVGGFW